MENIPENKKEKRKSLSLTERCHILDRLKAGESTTNLSNEYGVTRQAISKIKKKEKHILNAKNTLETCEGNLKKKKYKGVEETLLDKTLHEWFKQRRSMGFAISGNILKKKALMFNRRLGGKENFVASDGWLGKFKNRYSIREKLIQGEKLSGNVEASEDFKVKLTNIRTETGIDIEYIYNCDETALYWRLMPMRTLVGRNEKRAEGRKKPKNRITVLCCTNATGSHKLPLFVIGKSRKPRCFKGINYMPVHYVNQTNAWMTTALMKTWYTTVFLPEVRVKHKLHLNTDIKILLVMDNAGCHPPAKELNDLCDSCSILYLPPNVTALIQPLDQGIIEKFKKSYRSILLERVLTEDELGDGIEYLKSLNLINVFDFCQLAWNSVTENDIRHCWKNIIPLEADDNNKMETVDTSKIHDLLKKIPQFKDLSSDEVNDWLNIESDDGGWQPRSDDDLISNKYPDDNDSNNVEELDEVSYANEESTPADSIIMDNCPTLVEALSSFRVFLRWYALNGENFEIYHNVLQEINQNLVKKLVNEK